MGALDSQGRPSFQVLQNNLSRTLPVYFYAFDILNRDGEFLLSLPIERRRDLLGRMLPEPEDPLRLSPLLRAPSGRWFVKLELAKLETEKAAFFRQ